MIQSPQMTRNTEVKIIFLELSPFHIKQLTHHIYASFEYTKNEKNIQFIRNGKIVSSHFVFSAPKTWN